MKGGRRARGALALCLALLCLTSCARLLEREYTQVVEHIEDMPLLEDTAYRVDTYPSLRGAMLAYVEEGLDEGLLRCPTTYPGNLSVDLEKARRQLLEEDPLGNYALVDVQFSVSRIIAYYEVELDFTYRVDRREVAQMPRASTRQALAQTLSKTLYDRGERACVYLTAYPQEDERFFVDALREAYGIRADTLARPTMTVRLYPEGGEQRRVAEVELDYGDLADLEYRQERLNEALELFLGSEGRSDAQTLFDRLKGQCHLSQYAGSTAYEALVENRADREGMCLAYAALCQHEGMESRVVWTPQGCYVALVLQPGEEEVYLDMTASRFAPLEQLSFQE